MAKRKKRKLKKGFKIFLWIFFIALVSASLFYLNSKKIISFKEIPNNVSSNIDLIKNVFSKKTKKEEVTISPKSENERFIAIFRNRLPSKNLNFASSSPISENGDMKIFLKDTENDSGYIFINTKNDPSYVWITFVSAVDAEPLKGELENKLKYLDYIDLRFSNKVFYKFNVPTTPRPEALPISEESLNTSESTTTGTTTGPMPSSTSTILN